MGLKRYDLMKPDCLLTAIVFCDQNRFYYVKHFSPAVPVITSGLDPDSNGTEERLSRSSLYFRQDSHFLLFYRCSCQFTQFKSCMQSIGCFEHFFLLNDSGNFYLRSTNHLNGGIYPLNHFKHLCSYTGI